MKIENVEEFGVATYDVEYQAMWLIDNLNVTQKRRLEMLYCISEVARAPFLEGICNTIFDESISKLNKAISSGRCKSYKFCPANKPKHRSDVVQKMVNTLMLRYDVLDI